MPVEPPPARLPLGTYGIAGSALALSWIAGFVDGVCFLALLQVYTSHMTGNTAALGIHLMRAHWHQAAEHSWPLLMFVVGLIIGAALTELGRRRRWHSRLSLVMAVEVVLLLVLLIWAPLVAPPVYWLALPAFAMGMQTVTITRVGDQRVYTTYMTGMLSKFAESITGYGFWLHDARHQNNARTHGWMREAVRHRLLWQALLTVGLWALFLVGGLCGSVTELHWALHALLFPVAALIGLILLDWRHPIAAVGHSEPPGFER